MPCFESESSKSVPRQTGSGTAATRSPHHTKAPSLGGLLPFPNWPREKPSPALGLCRTCRPARHFCHGRGFPTVFTIIACSCAACAGDLVSNPRLGPAWRRTKTRTHGVAAARLQQSSVSSCIMVLVCMWITVAEKVITGTRRVQHPVMSCAEDARMQQQQQQQRD